MKYSAETVIHRPVSEVFNFIARFENVDLYVPGTIGRQTSEGPMRVGATGVEVLGPPFRGRRLEWRITRYEPDHRVSFANLLVLPMGSAADRVVTYEFEPVASGTRVLCSEEGELQGPLRIFSRLLAALGRRGRARVLKDIKRVLEAGVASERERAAT